MPAGLSIPAAAMLHRSRSVWPAEASALLARMSVAPTPGRAAQIARLIRDLKTGGVWTKLDLLYVLAAHDAQAARLNWVGTAFNLTAVNSPAFTINSGYAGTGGAAWLETSWSPAANAEKFTFNSSSMAAWVLNSRPGNTSRIMSTSNEYLKQVMILPRNTNGRVYPCMADGAVGPVVPDSSGFIIASRLSAGLSNVYRNGASLGTAASSDLRGSFPAETLLFLAYSSDSLAVSFMGAGLTATEQAAAYTAFQTYLQAVGAIT